MGSRICNIAMGLLEKAPDLAGRKEPRQHALEIWTQRWTPQPWLCCVNRPKFWDVYIWGSIFPPMFLRKDTFQRSQPSSVELVSYLQLKIWDHLL
jgi:hypothetical protein